MIDRSAWELTAAAKAGRLIFDAPLAKMTTYGVGGPAAILGRPESPEELSELLAAQAREDCPLYILGGGSNTLFVEKFEGLVIKLGKAFQNVEASEDGRVTAGAGVPTAAVLAASVNMELSGLEGLAGIPGNFGGALMMNAGSYGVEVGSAVESIFGLDALGQKFCRSKEELKLEYRRLTGLPDGAVMLGADLRLTKGRPEDIKELINEYLSRRSAGQPQGVRSAGSVFKNPPNLYAGKLIDECGFKGLAVGGARVSEIHANFIVAREPVEGGQILELLNKIRAGVYEQRGVILEPEIRIIGPRGPLAPVSLGVNNGRS